MRNRFSVLIVFKLWSLDKLDFFALEPDVYMPLVIAMAFISNNYSSGTLDDNVIVYCNTLFENNRQADGSVRIPEALRPYMGGLEKIEPKK